MRLLVTCALMVLSAGMSGVPTTPDPVRAIIAAFDRVNLVALGEDHLNVRELEFRLKLIQDPAFARTVNDIVIEFANPIHQSLLDRFVDGEDMPSEALDSVWTVTNQKSAYAPFYQQFVDGVRAVNRSLPTGRRLRVVAGDGRGSGTRDQIAADQIRREVLDKHRKALVVFGGFHFLRQRPDFLAKFAPSGTLVMVLQDDPRARWFVVRPVDGPDLPRPITVHRGTPEKPALISDNTALDMDAAYVRLADHPNQFRVRDLVDALLYFGSAAPVLQTFH